MRKTIYKYSVKVTETVSILAPPMIDIVFVECDSQHVMWFWALVDLDKPDVLHRFRVAGTGHQIQPDEKPVGSARDGLFVWHLLELDS